MKKIVLTAVLILLMLVSSSCAPEETVTSSSETPVSGQKIPVEQSIDTIVEVFSEDTGSGSNSNLPESISEEEMAELQEKYSDDPAKFDAAIYAKHMGISQEEAEYRFEIQDRAGPFGAELEANEKETLAGFWIQHEPEYGLVAAFTRDGEETLEKYREKYPDLVEITEVQSMQYTLQQLLYAQEKTNRELRAVELNLSSGTDVKNNRVEIYVTDSELFYSTLEENGIELLDCVYPVVIYEPLDEVPDGLNPDPSVHMAQLKMASGSYMDALLSGKLELVDGYLRVDEYLIIWQPDYFVHNNSGTIEIWDRDGNVVGRLCEWIQMGGGEGKNIPYGSLTEPVPEEIEGPVWIQGGSPRIVSGSQNEYLITGDLSAGEILDKIMEIDDAQPSGVLEERGIVLPPSNRSVYLDPDDEQYITIIGEYIADAGIDATLERFESALEYRGFRKKSEGGWGRDDHSGRRMNFFLVSKPSISLEVRYYLFNDGSPSVYELVVTEDLNLSQPYNEKLIPDDVDSVYLVYSGYAGKKDTYPCDILELADLVNALPVRPEYVILGMPGSETVFTLTFHSISQGDITVKSILGGGDSGINIDGCPVLSDVNNLLNEKVSEIIKKD
ncbi:MAG: hypothetical protein JW712_08100 [Dehalococcoidales bacterium]|nr:hypothetical protein [Dehalococcoidales bacterium]